MSNHDIRKVPLRLLGYGMAFSEALKFSFRNTKFLSFCRGITIGYAIFDMSIKTREASKKSSKDIFITAGDVFLWQTSASIILPTLTINQLCWISRIFMYNVHPSLANTLTTSIGISLIPSFIEPIDHITSSTLDATYRKYIPTIFEKGNKHKQIESKEILNVPKNEIPKT